MTDLILDDLGDIVIEDGDLVLIPTIQQLIRQQVQITLKTFRGEWKYNINFGPPYVSNENNPIQILGKVRKNFFDLQMREAILSVEGVIAIDNYTSTLNLPKQEITITFTASIESGVIDETITLTI